MRTLLALSALAIVAELAPAACLQSNLTQGAQSTGAVYDLFMPEISCWNGAIVVFAHGYVQPGLPIAVPTDQLVINGLSLPATFNQLGYGFAASSFKENGLAILDGVSDTENLVVDILQPQLHPSRVYLIGASEGGLVTVLSAEQIPQYYNGAGAACGPIGSFQAQIDYFGDFRVLFDYFFPGVIPGDAISIPGTVIAEWDSVYVNKITLAIENNPSAAAQLIKVMGAAVTSDPATIVETVVGALWYNVFGTADAQAKLHGQPYDNHNRIYIGSSNDFLLNLKVERYTASSLAAKTVAQNYETSGKLGLPIVTIHTTLDPIIPYWQETLYTAKTILAGTLLDRINIPVNAYGHCAFTAGDVMEAFSLIVLQDLGSNIAAEIESALDEPHRSDFINARQRQEALTGKH